MPKVLLANNASSTLAANITAVQTTIPVQAGDAAEFPQPGTDEWFPVTIEDAAGNTETLRCTARTGSTLTVDRGQEGTAANAFAAGTIVELRLTAAVINEIRSGDIESSRVTGDLQNAAMKPTPLVFDGAHTVVSADQGKVLEFSVSAVASLTEAAQLGSGFAFYVKAAGGDVTVDPSGSETINGATTLTVSTGTSALITCDGTGWRTVMVTTTPSAGGGGVPTGTIIEWPVDQFPDGYLLCDGRAVSRTEHAALFAVLQTRYGSGDGSTTFNLPDYQGVFRRGVDGGRGMDPDSASRLDRGDGTTGDNVGTLQMSAFAWHVHAASTASGGGHSHSASINPGGAHGHTGSTHGAGAHNHQPADTAFSFVTRINSGQRNPGYELKEVPYQAASGHGESYQPAIVPTGGPQQVTTTVGNHAHGLSINNAGDHSHGISIQNGGSHSHTVNIGGTGANETRPTNITTYVLMKT